jgi:hypothetical protein
VSKHEPARKPLWGWRGTSGEPMGKAQHPWIEHVMLTELEQNRGCWTKIIVPVIGRPKVGGLRGKNKLRQPVIAKLIRRQASPRYPSLFNMRPAQPSRVGTLWNLSKEMT